MKKQINNTTIYFNELKKSFKKNLIDRLSVVLIISIFTLIGGFVGAILNNYQKYVALYPRVDALEEYKTGVDQSIQKLDTLEKKIDTYVSKTDTSNKTRDDYAKELNESIRRIDSKIDSLLIKLAK